MAEPNPPPQSFAQSIVGRDRLNVGRIGLGRRMFDDLYHRSVRMSWPAFFGLFALAFLLLNLLFAGLYMLDTGGLVHGVDTGTTSPFLRCFFFSVHTIATVGYGNVYPASLYVNAVVVVEIAVGILVIALTSGIAFARFSIPTARVLFSEVAVVREFEGAPTLMFRAANQRNNFIVEASVRLSLLRTVPDGEGTIRRFYDLPLVRSTSPAFVLSWLVMHRIDETSPLYGMTQADWEASGDELVVLMTGTDSSISQFISARHAFGAGNVLWGHRFADILGSDADGRRWIDYARFHEAVPEG